MNGARNINFFFCPAPWGPGEGSKSFNFNYNVNFKDFYFVCVLTNERYKTYQTGFSLCSLSHASGVVLWGAEGALVVKKSNFQTWSCGISNRRG